MDKQLHTVNIYNQYVKEYIAKFMNFDLYNDTFDYFLKLLPRESNILELGCGPGNVVKYFSTRRRDLNILGVDLSLEMIKQAEKINPDSDRI
jgi:ubiquinone/menaquinone biosynthesis C-methylase UbiE